jgi:hypothetical protein
MAEINTVADPAINRFWQSNVAFRLLVAIGVSLVICVTMPWLIFLLVLSIIASPLALPFVISPSLMLYYGAAYAGGFRWGPRGAGIALVGTAALTTIPAIQGNRWQERIVENLIAGDKSDLSIVFRPKTLAITQPFHRADLFGCSELCVRLLLNGEIDRVIIVPVPTAEAVPSDYTEGTAYSIEQRPTCPDVKLEGSGGLRVEGEQRQGQERVSVPALLAVAVATGRCIVHERATLAAADALIVRGAGAVGRDRSTFGLSIFADTVTAQRHSLFLREGDTFREVYRRTGVVYRRLTPVLLPTFSQETKGALPIAFFRDVSFIGTSDMFSPEPDWNAFLQQLLGLRLKLDTTGNSESLRTQLSKSLEQPGELPVVTANLMNSINQEAVRGRRLRPGDVRLLARYIADPRATVVGSHIEVLDYAKDEPLVDLQAVAEAAFQRLRSIPTTFRGQNEDPALHNQVSTLARAIAALPAKAMEKRFDDFVWLAQTHPLRISAGRALPQLSAFGEQGLPILLRLLDEGGAAQPPQNGGLLRPDLRHLIHWGLTGLCKLGAAAGPSAVGELSERVRSQETDRIHIWRLLLSTLVSMGASDETIRAFFDHVGSYPAAAK